MSFVPALLVVDFQEDFCPPNGSLAVPDGRAIAPVVNELLALPFALKIATKDWHPADHISFSINHTLHKDGSSSYQPDPALSLAYKTDGGSTSSKDHPPPFTSKTTITHPTEPTRTYETTVWPPHCIQDTDGANLVHELRTDLLTHTIHKGTEPLLEMYSAFRDPFSLCDSGMAKLLKEAGVTDVYVVGLAGEFCVPATAKSAAEDGFRTWMVEEGTRCVNPDRWKGVKRDVEASGVKIVQMGGEEVNGVRKLDRT